MTRYRSGYSAERDLRQILEAKGWRVIRSGGSKKPDLIAGKGGEVLVLECKATNDLEVYIEKEEATSLVQAAAAFAARPALAVKFKKRGWVFFDARKLEKAGKHLVARTGNSAEIPAEKLF